MNKEDREKIQAYEDSLSEMPRWKLIKECVRMKKRINALSKICDTEDIYNAYNEQQKAQRDLMMANRHLDKVKSDLQKALAERGIKFNESWDIKTLAHFLIKGTESINQ